MKSSGVWVILLLETHTAMHSGVRPFPSSIFPPVKVADLSLPYVGCPVTSCKLRQTEIHTSQK